MIPIKLFKKTCFFSCIYKNGLRKYYVLYNQAESYNIVDLYLNNNKFFGYKDFYNYYDIDVDKILLFRSCNEYIIRYYDVNKMKVVPLQLKIKNFFSELHTFLNDCRIMFIYSNDKELVRKCRDIWNKITELIGTNNTGNFDETNLDDDDGFITAYAHKNTSFAEGSYRNKLIIVFHSVFNDYPQTSLGQHKY